MARCQGSCESKLGNQGDWIECGQCKLKYCYGCAGVKQTTWNKMNDEKREEWKCKQRCRKQRVYSEQDEENVGDKEEVEGENATEMDTAGKIDERLENEIIDRMSRMETKLDKIITTYEEQSKKLEEAITKIESVCEEQKDMKKENIEIKAKLQTLEEKIQAMENKEEKTVLLEKKLNTMYRETKEKEQYDRNRNLEINQLDWLQEENLKQVINDLARNFNIAHQDAEIETAHIIPNRNRNKPSTVIIQFKHRNSRDKWLNEKKRIVTNDNMYRNGNRQRIYINENMTPFMKTLFWKTKTWAKQNDYSYVWFKNGKILMRKNKEEEEVKTIHEEEDLMNLQA